MKRWLERMNSSVRALAIVVAIALVVVVLQLSATLIVVAMLAQIAFFLAIAYFCFLMWQRNRGDIALWSARTRAVFYSAIAIVLINLGVFFGARVPRSYSLHLSGFTAVAWIIVFPLCGYAAWRVWHDEHSYS